MQYYPISGAAVFSRVSVITMDDSAVLLVFSPPLQTEISQQFLNDCYQNLYRRSCSPEDEYAMIWSSDFSSPATLRLTFLVQSEMAKQLCDGLPWQFEHTLISLQDELITLVIL